MIPDEAVEAAAVGIWDARPMQRSEDGAPLPFLEAKPYLIDRYRTLARAALEAAAPHIRAGVVREKQAEALEEVAVYLDGPRVIWYGQDGATVREMDGYTAALTPLVKWLQSQAASYRDGFRG